MCGFVFCGCPAFESYVEHEICLRFGSFLILIFVYLFLFWVCSSLKLQKRLAASVMRCGKKKVWLDPNEINEIANTNSSKFKSKLCTLHFKHPFCYCFRTKSSARALCAIQFSKTLYPRIVQFVTLLEQCHGIPFGILSNDFLCGYCIQFYWLATTQVILATIHFISLRFLFFNFVEFISSVDEITPNTFLWCTLLSNAIQLIPRFLSISFGC